MGQNIAVALFALAGVALFDGGADVSFMHATVNRNKRALSVDVRTEQGRDIFLQLGADADVIVKNFKVGTMTGYGLGYEQLCNIMLGNWLASHTREEAISTFRETGLPIAPVNTYAEAAKDPHVLERDMLQQTKLHDGGSAPITGPAVKFSRTPTWVGNCAPEIGQHNVEILESIGLDAQAQQALSESGVIS